MNKFLLFLAFASFALFACSEDKSPPTHSELCAKKPTTKECLVGRWYLDKVLRGESDNNRDPDCDHRGRDLKLEKNGNFSFEGGVYEIESYGKWNLNENGDMEIEFTGGDLDDNIPKKFTATVNVNYTGTELKLAASGHTSFSQCRIESSTKLVEVFTWQNSN